jgi:hypothetical protein
MMTESKLHECESWEMLQNAEGTRYCAACGKDETPKDKQ